MDQHPVPKVADVVLGYFALSHVHDVVHAFTIYMTSASQWLSACAPSDILSTQLRRTILDTGRFFREETVFFSGFSRIAMMESSQAEDIV